MFSVRITYQYVQAKKKKPHKMTWAAFILPVKWINLFTERIL